MGTETSVVLTNEISTITIFSVCRVHTRTYQPQVATYLNMANMDNEYLPCLIQIKMLAGTKKQVTATLNYKLLWG